jgi:hypothetical protein
LYDDKSDPNPKSDGFGDENPNPTDTDFLYIRHILDSAAALAIVSHKKTLSMLNKTSHDSGIWN